MDELYQESAKGFNVNVQAAAREGIKRKNESLYIKIQNLNTNAIGSYAKLDETNYKSQYDILKK